MNTLIVYESLMLEVAKELKSWLSQTSAIVEGYAVEIFPIADPMILFLSNLASKADLVLMLIASDTKGYDWISRELKMQRSMGNFHNIYPVFATKADVPKYWKDGEQKFLTMTNIATDLANIIN